MTATVTQKGQVTIPKEVRDQAGIGPGSKVEFALGLNGEIVLRKVERRSAAGRTSRFAQVRGSADVKLTTDEIMAMLRGDPQE